MVNFRRLIKGVEISSRSVLLTTYHSHQKNPVKASKFAVTKSKSSQRILFKSYVRRMYLEINKSKNKIVKYA